MLHSQLIKQTGGIDGVRDLNLLESAIEAPFQAFSREELFFALNGIELRYTQKELYEMVLAVADGTMTLCLCGY